MVEHVLNSMDEIITNDYSESHQALDLVGQRSNESDIIALDSGIVEEVVTNSPSTDHNSVGMATYGNYVKIKQNNGKSALYAHMKYGSINVNAGDYVEKGAIIGTMGNTGNAYGNHLHLEIKNENNIKENPIVSLTTKNESNTEEKKETPIEEKKETPIEEKKETPIEEKKETPKTIKITKAKTTKEKLIKEEYISNKSYYEGSIVDGLKEINIDSSYNYREKLAEKNGIQNYRGSYEQNVYLLSLLKEGKLIKA